MENSPTRLSDSKSAHVFVSQKRGETSGVDVFDPLEAPDPNEGLFSYFFELQGEVEKEGFMDYNVYAKRMWGKFYGDLKKPEEAQGEFENFRINLIGNLHSIDMVPIVYPHVRENMAALIGARVSQIKELSLWSTGDVAATGYQVGKIEKSGIVGDFLKTVVRAVPRDEQKIIAGKTRYMVDDNKFERLVDHVRQLKKDGEEKPKIVIIEDSSKNFDIVKQELDETFSENHGIEVVPVWATYSREGINETKKAVGDDEKLKLEQKRKRLNAINSFSDLLSPQFDTIFEDAHVFVDFDGVIGDNVAMRKVQAKAIFSSLQNAGIALGLTREQLSQRLTIQKAA